MGIFCIIGASHLSHLSYLSYLFHSCALVLICLKFDFNIACWVAFPKLIKLTKFSKPSKHYSAHHALTPPLEK